MNIFSLFSSPSNLAAALCRVNGQEVPCPDVTVYAPIFIFVVFVIVLMVASLWRIFTKAHQPGWASLIPIYNTVVLLQIIKKPIWWIFLLFIPFVNLIILLLVYVELSRVFGKGVGYTLGLIFLPVIFYPLLAFGDAQYQSDEVVPTMTV